jgi:hypothetical protein
MLTIREHLKNHVAWYTLFFVYTAIAFFHLYKGSVLSPDTLTFIKSAKILIGHEFNFLAYYSDVSFPIPPFLYTIPITALALAISIFDEHWVIAFQSLNLVALFFTLFIYVKITLHLKVRQWLVSLSLLFFIISVDFLLWPRYILTDTLFSATVMFAIYTVIVGTNNRPSYYALIVFSSLLLLFSRPSSPSFIVVFLFFGILIDLSQRILIKKTLFLRLGILTLFASTFYSVLLMAYASGVFESPVFELWQIYNMKGIVIWDRPETSIVYEATYLGIAKLHLLRMGAFFQPFESTFSLVHNVLNGLQILGCYVVIFALFHYSFIDFEKNNNRAKAIALLSTLIVFVAISTSFFVVDYDWRYRYPIIAPLIMLATLIYDNFLSSREPKIAHEIG